LLLELNQLFEVLISGNVKPLKLGKQEKWWKKKEKQKQNKKTVPKCANQPNEEIINEMESIILTEHQSAW